MTSPTPHRPVIVLLLDESLRDAGDRIPLAVGCAVLGVLERTFRRQYLSNDHDRATATARFALEKVAGRGQTVSRRLMEVHRAEITGGSWGGPHCPPGAWGRRLREAAEREASAAQAGADAAAVAESPTGADVEATPPVAAPATVNPQRDLFES